MKKIIFFGSTDSVLNQMYSDIQNDEEVLYKQGMVHLNNFIKRLLFKLTFSQKVNQYLKFPCKDKWFSLFIGNNVALSSTPIFVFTKDNFKYLEFGYAKYLKKQYINCKIILLFLDIHGLRGYDFKNLNNYYDEAYVFDEIEANKYNISYYPLCYSHSIYENQKKIYDICFIGQDKGRLEKIYVLYKNAIKKNLKCKIIITGKTNVEKNNYPGIIFVNSIKYDDALKIISKSRYNLEVSLKDTSSFSIRINESIMFNQGLITNNNNIVNAPYYNGSFIFLVDFDNLDLSFITNGKSINNEDLKNEISPLNFIKLIKAKYLNKENNYNESI